MNRVGYAYTDIYNIRSINSHLGTTRFETDPVG